MRNLEGVAQSLGSKSAMKNLELIGRFYHSLDDNLKSKLEAFLPSSQWSFQTFMVFSAGISLTLMPCNAMKTRRCTNDQDLFKVTMESINLKLLLMVSLVKMMQNGFVWASACCI